MSEIGIWSEITSQQWDLPLPYNRISLFQVISDDEAPYFMVQTASAFRIVNKVINASSIDEAKKKALQVSLKEIETTESLLQKNKDVLFSLLY